MRDNTPGIISGVFCSGSGFQFIERGEVVGENNGKRQGCGTLLGVANLVLTAVIGIGVAVFLSYRQEQVQKDLVELEAIVEQQTSIAHLKINTTCPSAPLPWTCVIVKNTGSATANNVRLVVVLTEVDEGWNAAGLDNISVLEHKEFPATIQSTITYKEVNTPRDLDSDEAQDGMLRLTQLTAENAIEVFIETLPLDAEYTLSLRVPVSIPYDTYAQQAHVTAYLEDMLPRNTREIEGVIGQNLAQYFWVGTFSATAGCDNCQGTLEEDVRLTSFEDWYSSGDVTTREGNNADEWLNEFGYMWSGQTDISFTYPQGMTCLYPIQEFFEFIIHWENDELEISRLFPAAESAFQE